MLHCVVVPSHRHLLGRSIIDCWMADFWPPPPFDRSLRALYGTDGTRNATHGSDSPASATREIKFFFPHLIIDDAPSMDPVFDTLQPALLEALTALAKNKMGSSAAATLKFLGEYLLEHSTPNKGTAKLPGQWEPVDGPDAENFLP